MPKYAIDAQNLTKSYGNSVVLSDLTLQIEPGLIYGLLGPNGAGKLTTISILTGLLVAESGSISILGQRITPEALEVRRLLGVGPVGLALFE